MDTNTSKHLSELIAERQLSVENIGRVMRLYSSNRDVFPYLQKEYTDAQLQEILIGLEDGCDVSFYDNIKLSPEQMRAIRLGISHPSGGQPITPSVESEPSNEQSAEVVVDEVLSTKENTDLPSTEMERQAEEPQSEDADKGVDDNESERSDGKIFGGIIVVVIVVALILLPRLIAERSQNKAIETMQGLKERGLVVKDGEIKYEPKATALVDDLNEKGVAVVKDGKVQYETSVTTVTSGVLSLAHRKGWISETGNADGYGYHINLSCSSPYVAGIQVALFNNPNQVSLSSAESLAKNQISSLFGGIKVTIETARSFDLNGIPARVFNYRLSATGEGNMHRRCITAVKDKYVLLIHEAFEEYNDKDFDYIFGHIERSIKIKSQN